MKTAERLPTFDEAFSELADASERLKSFGAKLIKMADELEQGKPVSPKALRKLSGQIKWWNDYGGHWFYVCDRISWENGKKAGKAIIRESLKLPTWLCLKGRFETGEVWLNDKLLPLTPSLELENHSPTGFSWGYQGSGPAQLALAILLGATGNKEWARRNYQQFKFDVIAGLPQSDFEMIISLAGWTAGDKIYKRVIQEAGNEPTQQNENHLLPMRP